MRVVQRTPNLGLSIRLQRQVAAPDSLPPPPAPDPDPDPDPDPGGCPCDATGVTWAIVPDAVPVGDGYYPRLPTLQFQTQPHQTSLSIVAAGSDGFAAPTWRLIGAPLGVHVGGVTWDISWSAPSVFGESATAAGPVLVVSIPPSDYASGGAIVNTLTATAYCGEDPVGTLTLRLRKPQPV